jgi:hypothetical protein
MTTSAGPNGRARLRLVNDRDRVHGLVSARDQILLWGLVDWVDLDRIHREVASENADSNLAEIQQKTLTLIQSVVEEGLFELGDLSGADGAFVKWDSSVQDSIVRIRDVYVAHFDDRNVWPWYCWLNLTAKGERVAHSIDANPPRP